MQSGAVQTFTFIGLRSDVDMSDLFIAGVITGPVAEEFAILETSEEEFTRWAMEFDAPDADTAAAHAYLQCRTDDEVEEDTAGALLQAVLADVSIRSRRGGDVSAGAVWIWVLAGADACVRISGTGDTENEIDHDPAEHHGWYVVYDSDAADAPDPVVLSVPAPAADPDVLTDVQSTTPQAPALEPQPGAASAPAPVVLAVAVRGRSSHHRARKRRRQGTALSTAAATVSRRCRWPWWRPVRSSGLVIQASASACAAQHVRVPLQRVGIRYAQTVPSFGTLPSSR